MIRMRALSVPVAVVGVVTGLLIGAPVAAGSGGPVIPGGAYGGTGVTGPSDAPSGDYRYVALDADAGGTIVEKIATDGGNLVSLRRLNGPWTLPAVTIDGDAGGLSADGGTLVLIRPHYDRGADETRLLILDADRGRGLQGGEEVDLRGRFSFDAISPDGHLIYLVQYENPRNPLDYRVRAYDLAAGEFRKGDIVDPEAPDEQMTGQPVERETSPDGRWAYTLYGGGEETFIHALDTEGATAVCIDLAQFGPRSMYVLDLSVDPSTGAITVGKQGELAAVVDPRTFEVGRPPAEQLADAVGQGAEAPDGGGIPAWTIVLGATGMAGAAYLLIRRRRHGDPIDEEALERMISVDAEQRPEEERKWQPVP